MIDGVYCVYHYHYDRKIRSLFNKNSYFLGANFKKRLNEYVEEGEEFSLGKAETDGTLVIELEGVNEKGLRYEYATKEQIDGFKKYINN